MSTPVKKVPIHLQSAQNRLLIKNGKVVNEDDIVEEDVYIEDGIIKQLGRNLIIPGGTRVIDARGKLVIPGGIDPHTHFEFEFMNTTSVDDFYQGTKAAVAGGTTMIIDFVLVKKGESLLDSYYSYRQKADEKVCCDYALHVIISYWNDKVFDEMSILCSEHGVNSFKTFMAYSFMLNDSELYSAFEACKKLGAVAMVHAENGSIVFKNTEKLLAKGVTGPEGHELSRPEEVEAEAVNRACTIANQVKTPLYVAHISNSHSAKIIAERQANGQIIFGEVLASAAALAGDRHNVTTITSPPLRSNSDTPSQLLGLLASNDLQLTGSDNCTFNKSQKEMGLNDFSKIPNGVNGVEDRMSVIWEKGVHSGLIDACRFVAITSTTAAKIFNLYPRKGCIALGSDADIVIWNPNKTRTISAKTHHQAVDFNIFEGMECHGVPEYVIVNGRVCVDDEQVKVVQGHGNYIECPVFPPFVYDIENASKLKPSDNGDANWVTQPTQKENDRKVCPTPTLPESSVSTPSCKGPRPEGQRNLQDSTFSISEDLDVARRACIKVQNPPGGKSSGFW
ncbi:dihydropyrimidinase isoform X2 [Photinus pyralis]|uniref:dihydropyrimidinase n=1 Tax=Photinus pyralis TaxID=7054 RepID=A0A1Y1K2S8_PHOPY|nr:dihydropyrimidinase isoform X2 [Photinus pyralis]